MSIGILVGFSDAMQREDYDLPGRGAVYTISLALGLEGLVLLTLDLVYSPGRSSRIGFPSSVDSTDRL